MMRVTRKEVSRLDNQVFVTIDAGTSNTRVLLWNRDRKILAAASENVGVRHTAIDGNNAALKRAVKKSLKEVLDRSGSSLRDVKAILASGMLTSNMGLWELPHLVAPVGIADSAAHIEEVHLPDVCPKPIWLIPGIKNKSGRIDRQNFEEMDIMRGEEVESFALIDAYFDGSPMLLVLPGSHNKFVLVNRQGAITGCLTTLSGELLHSLTNDTILADSVGRKFVENDSYAKDMVLEGYRTGLRVGLTRACFSARILDLFSGESKERIAGYLLGAVLSGDLEALKNSGAIRPSKDCKVVIAGNGTMRRAIHDILTEDESFDRVEMHEGKDDMPLSAIGAYLVATKAGIV